MFMFFRCVVEEASARGVRGLLELIDSRLGKIADFADGVYKRWKKDRADAQERVKLRAEVEQMAQATFDEIRAAAAEAVKPLMAVNPQLGQEVEQYLTQIPNTIRQTFRRPDDESGTTVPDDFRLDNPDDVARLLPDHLPRFKTGDRLAWLPDWEFAEQLGAGGFVQVWKIVNRRMKRTSALKICLDPVLAQSLENEVELLGYLQELTLPGVVQLQETYLSADPPALRYEFVAGGDLTGLIRSWQALPMPERVQQAGKALRELAVTAGQFHRLDPFIVHRDLKPANVLVSQGRLKVADLGIGAVSARRALDAEPLGGASRTTRLPSYLRGAHTPLYASPQQKKGATADPRDDVHALGVMGIQMLTGVFDEGAAHGFESELVDLGARQEFVSLLGSCVHKNPDKRPKHGLELAQRLGELFGIPQSSLPVAASTVAVPLAPAQLESVVSYSFDQDPPGSTVGVLPVTAQVEDRSRDVEEWYQKGQAYFFGQGVPQDYQQARHWYAKAAEKGHAGAMNDLGVLHRDGLGSPQDYQQARHWFTQAAEKGEATAMSNLGVLHFNGLGVPQDWQQARHWLTQAAEKGEATAMSNLGILYRHGYGVLRDYRQALYWYMKAAEKGYPLAMAMTGCMYHTGEGVLQDYQQAMHWYTQAAEKGDATAMCNIGCLYENGLGVSKDLEHALKWYRNAAAQGHSSANDAVKRLGDGRSLLRRLLPW